MHVPNTQAIWTHSDRKIFIIDQRFLPHRLETQQLTNVEEVYFAIKNMQVRGAPLIGVTAAYGMYLALMEALSSNQMHASFFENKLKLLNSARPTAVNLSWATQIMKEKILSYIDDLNLTQITFEAAKEIENQEIENCKNIGENGLVLLKELAAKKKGETLNILTHCNAGWLACVQYGTATAPIYAAHKAGIPVHVWVDETRPRNQGARLTAWELQQAGIPYTVIADNTGGHLMQHGLVDCCIVGSDRTTRRGDVANKIGTYLKALAAHDNNVPFFVALPSSTFDFSLRNGVAEIPIESRGSEEVKYIQGWYKGEIVKILITPKEAKAVNYGFDVTPAKYVTQLITERGNCSAKEEAIVKLFPDICGYD